MGVSVGAEEQPATLGLRVAVGADADAGEGAAEIAEATLQLRRELLELDAEAVDVPGAGEPPPGSKAVELAAIGVLVVTVAQSPLLAEMVSPPAEDR